MIEEEHARIIEIIKNGLNEHSYFVGEECVDAIAAEIWAEFGCNILNGYA